MGCVASYPEEGFGVNDEGSQFDRLWLTDQDSVLGTGSYGIVVKAQATKICVDRTRRALQQAVRKGQESTLWANALQFRYGDADQAAQELAVAPQAAQGYLNQNFHETAERNRVKELQAVSFTEFATKPGKKKKPPKLPSLSGLRLPPVAAKVVSFARHQFRCLFVEEQLAGANATKLRKKCRFGQRSVVYGRGCVISAHEQLDRSLTVRYLREEVALRDMRGHPNICQLLDVFVRRGRAGRSNWPDEYGLSLALLDPVHSITLVLELFHTTCRQALDQGVRGDWHLWQHLTSQLLAGVEFMHNQCWLHNDIKPDQCGLIMSGEDPSNMRLARLVLCDLGFAQTFNPATGKAAKGEFPGCTPHYAAPEVLVERLTSTKSDIWGVGCTAYFIIGGRSAARIFKGQPFQELLRKHPDFKDMERSMENYGLRSQEVISQWDKKLQDGDQTSKSQGANFLDKKSVPSPMMRPKSEAREKPTSSAIRGIASPLALVTSEGAPPLSNVSGISRLSRVPSNNRAVVSDVGHATRSAEIEATSGVWQAFGATPTYGADPKEVKEVKQSLRAAEASRQQEREKQDARRKRLPPGTKVQAKADDNLTMIMSRSAMRVLVEQSLNSPECLYKEAVPAETAEALHVGVHQAIKLMMEPDPRLRGTATECRALVDVMFQEGSVSAAKAKSRDANDKGEKSTTDQRPSELGPQHVELKTSASAQRRGEAKVQTEEGVSVVRQPGAAMSETANADGA